MVFLFGEGRNITIHTMKPICIVAVSGGVDSMVLLHKLVQANTLQLVVVHVDHGIRPDAQQDAQLVAATAKKYGLVYEQAKLHLGPQASENTARMARWEALRESSSRHRATMIATAHHADDVVETIIINLLRGTGWRGIASLYETPEISRPLLGLRKHAILAYARTHHLAWREDSTNQQMTYLRNRVRLHIMPHIDDTQFGLFLKLHAAQLVVKQSIEPEALRLAQTSGAKRYYFIMWPDEVAKEVLRTYVGSLTKNEMHRVLLFVRVARPHRRLTLTNGKLLKTTIDRLIVIEADN